MTRRAGTALGRRLIQSLRASRVPASHSESFSDRIEVRIPAVAATFVGAYGWRTQLPAGFARVAFWPVTLLIKGAGTGPNIGTPERPNYEWTPVHLLALGLGLALSWLFYVLVA
jgi:hypothetical protein